MGLFESLLSVTDSCQCGAEVNLYGPSSEVRSAHFDWLLTHQVCRGGTRTYKVGDMPVRLTSDEGEPTVIADRHIVGIQEDYYVCLQCDEGIYAGHEVTKTIGGNTFCHECASELV